MKNLLPQSFLKIVSEKLKADIILYQADISLRGAEKIIEITCHPKNENVLFILRTRGGCPHSAFKIARRLQDKYSKFYLYVDGFCKSAGTLIAIGSDEIIMSDYAEFGPLDVQLQEKDEVAKYSSGLNINEALLNLKQDSINFFMDVLIQLTAGAGITTKTAAEVASNLAINFFSPIISQISPIRIGETNRAVQIALAYGERLLANRGNLSSPKALVQLVQTYPDHSFMIDFKEAASIFRKIRKELDDEQKMIKDLMIEDGKGVQFLYPKETDNESIDKQTNFDGVGKSEAAKGIVNAANTERLPKAARPGKESLPVE